MKNSKMDKKIAELKALAMNADVAGWKGLSLARPSAASGACDDNWHVVNDNDTMSTHCFDFNHSTSVNSESVARFIAAASPEFVIGLIEALAAETCKADRYRTKLEKPDAGAVDAAPSTAKREVFITRKLLTKLIGCRSDTIDRMVAKGELPKPIRLGANGRHRFIASEIIPALMKHDIDLERLAMAHGVDLNNPDA